VVTRRARRTSPVFFALGVLVASSACALVLDLERGEPLDAGDIDAEGAGDGDGDSTVFPLDAPTTDARADGALRCPEAGAPMLPIPESTFCIDTREVTNGEYAVFLADVLDGGAPPIPGCSANVYTPPNWATAADASASTLPVSQTSVCDALGYCASVGKHLCSRNEWSHACRGSLSETVLYPYPDGAAYDPVVCNVKDRGLNATVPVASQPGCVGGYPGLHDFSGNVAEWTVDTPDNPGATCYYRGGSFESTALDSTCSIAYTFANCLTRALYRGIGFRCCADSR
jgi:formylglycine-generating enzyme required for sulfatase activity